VNHEWLSDALFAIAFANGGLPGLLLLRILSLSVALIALNRGLREVSWPLRDGLITAVVLMGLPLLGDRDVIPPPEPVVAIAHR